MISVIVANGRVSKVGVLALFVSAKRVRNFSVEVVGGVLGLGDVLWVLETIRGGLVKVGGRHSKLSQSSDRCQWRGETDDD